MNIYYVYAYFDPESNLPFYIGKGKQGSNRHLAHLNETIENTGNKRKFYKIQKIKNKGFEPVIQIINDNLSEDKAYQFETYLIQKYGRKDIDKGGILTNICIDNRPPVTSGSNHWLVKNPERHPNRGKQLSEKTKKKIGAANSIHMKGNIPWNQGISMNQLTKENLSNSLKLGYQNGRPLSSSVFQKGRTPHNVTGEIYYFESKTKIICTDNLTKLAKEFGINNPSGFSMLKRGILKTYKDYKFLVNPTTEQINKAIKYLYH